MSKVGWLPHEVHDSVAPERDPMIGRNLIELFGNQGALRTSYKAAVKMTRHGFRVLTNFPPNLPKN